ncbi:MAG: hypothetical protein V1773_07510 [bacterium]
MMITSNTIGNYNPYSINNSRTVSDLKNTQTADNNTKVTSEEKEFFTKMYPENKTEIIDYHYYQRTGKMSGVSVGSMFDRRG